MIPSLSLVPAAVGIVPDCVVILPVCEISEGLMPKASHCDQWDILITKSNYIIYTLPLFHASQLLWWALPVNTRIARVAAGMEMRGKQLYREH